MWHVEGDKLDERRIIDKAVAWRKRLQRVWLQVEDSLSTKCEYFVSEFSDPTL